MGNWIAASLYGHDRVYFVFGVNKIRSAPEEAICRARHEATLKNARCHYMMHTGCVVIGRQDRADCVSPDRICNALVSCCGKRFPCQVEIAIDKNPFLKGRALYKK